MIYSKIINFAQSGNSR